jgi:hypothetical protein
MSVLRAILGRFARFLVRVARTLDPALTAAPYWVMPERMAALRQRYPGAPEHWLEFVARRTAVDQTRAPYAPPDAVVDRVGERSAPPPQPHSRPPDTTGKFQRLRDRPTLSFPRSDSRSNPSPSEPPVVAPAVSNPPTATPEIPVKSRTDLKFIARAVRNPIANLLRIERPARHRPALNFPADHPAAHDEHDAVGLEPLVRREPQAFFADLGHRDAYRTEVFGDDSIHHATSAQPDMRWPRRPERSLVDVTWLHTRPGAPRHDPSFQTHDPRWPELPALAADDGSSPRASLDDAILLAEQIGGTWSG